MIKRASQGVAIAGLTLLAACSTSGVSFEKTSSIDGDGGPVRNGMGYSLVEDVSVRDAFVRLSNEIARPVAIDERLWANGITQYITLSADAQVVGENRIETRLISQSTISDLVEKAEPHGIEAHEIRRQFRAAFPGQRFSVDPSIHQNHYGSFSFSFFNPKSGVGCMFGWQNVEATHNRPHGKQSRNWITELRKPDRNAKLSYRIRYCGAGFKWSDAVDVMKSVQLNVSSDVFTRDRRVAWSNGSNFSSGLAGNNPEDLNYVTTAPYSERRDGLCEPGTTLGTYNQYGSPCPEKPKPVVRKSAPKPKPAVRAVTRRPAALATTSKTHATVPLPAPAAQPVPVTPAAPTAVPTIQAVQPQAPIQQAVVPAPSTAAVPTVPMIQPAIQPVSQPAKTPRIIPIVQQPATVPTAPVQPDGTATVPLPPAG